jgi:hypothetical protein
MSAKLLAERSSPSQPVPLERLQVQQASLVRSPWLQVLVRALLPPAPRQLPHARVPAQPHIDCREASSAPPFPVSPQAAVEQPAQPRAFPASQLPALLSQVLSSQVLQRWDSLLASNERARSPAFPAVPKQVSQARSSVLRWDSLQALNERV